MDRITKPKRTPIIRASRDEMAARLDAIYAIVEEIRPCSVRQTFYQTTVRGLMDKTERGYIKVQRALVAMRRDAQPFLSFSIETLTIRPRRSVRFDTVHLGYRHSSVGGLMACQLPALHGSVSV